MNKNLLFYFLVLSSLIILSACKDKSTPVEIGTDPTIESIQMRQKWNSEDTTLYKYKVEVNTTDPQGFSNLSGVFMEVRPQGNTTFLFNDSLYDDGAYFHINDGDVIAGDGVFSNKFSVLQILSGAADGEYVFEFTVFDKEGHASQPSEHSALFGPNVRPEIISVSGSDTLISGTQGEVFQVAVFDSNGVDDVIRTYFDIKDGSNQLLETADLFNDGDFSNHGDLFADDSIYSIKLDSTFGAGRIGTYRLEFHTEDSFDEGNFITPIHQIYIENKIGRFLNISVPDSIEKPALPTEYNRKLITAKVNDPQGLTDIDSVYFFSLKPNDSLANNGNPFPMVDNGNPFDISDPWNNAGDEDAEDGTYSLSILIFGDPETLLGKYVFSFYMRDEVGNLTEVSKDSIIVY